jgi:hypothetical protein
MEVILMYKYEGSCTVCEMHVQVWNIQLCTICVEIEIHLVGVPLLPMMKQKILSDSSFFDKERRN